MNESANGFQPLYNGSFSVTVAPSQTGSACGQGGACRQEGDARKYAHRYISHAYVKVIWIFFNLFLIFLSPRTVLKEYERLKFVQSGVLRQRTFTLQQTNS